MDITAIDGNCAAITILSTADGGSTARSSGVDVTAMDDCGAGAFAIITTNACMMSVILSINHQLTIIVCLAIDIQLIIFFHLNKIRCNFGAVAEDDVMFTSARTLNLVVLHVILDYIGSGLNSDIIAAGQRGVVAAFQNLDFCLNGVACVVP